MAAMFLLADLLCLLPGPLLPVPDVAVVIELDPSIGTGVLADVQAVFPIFWQNIEIKCFTY